MQRRRMLGVLLGALVVGALVGGGRAEAQHPIVDVSGEWNSVFAGGTSTLRLTQYGATVVGVYGSSSSMPGAMSGRINGRVMIGRWTDAASSVGLPDGVLAGRAALRRHLWGVGGLTVDSNTSGGPWIGSR